MNTAFLGLGIAFATGEHGVQKDVLLLNRLGIGFEIDDKQPVGKIDLVGGTPDAVGRVHQIKHFADDAVQLLIHAFQRLGQVAQRGMRIENDLQNGDSPAYPVSGTNQILW